MPTGRKILFLGEAYRADAITWMDGLREFGGFEIVTWELRHPGHTTLSRVRRFAEYLMALRSIRRLIRRERPDMVIAERTTSYGFLAAVCGLHPLAIAQQGRTDLWPENSLSLPLKRWLQQRAFSRADLIHAWGPVMTVSMQEVGVDMSKVMVLPKGIDLVRFRYAEASDPHFIVTRSLMPEYRHDLILDAFAELHRKGIDFRLTIVGDGNQRKLLEERARSLGISDQTVFTGRIPNHTLPELLANASHYVSMPVTEGVSGSLFEAMACGCFPIVTDLPGNRSWVRDGENGRLVPDGDLEKLTEALEWALQHPELRQKAIRENRHFVERHANYHTNMKRIADRYHELINASEGHVRH